MSLRGTRHCATVSFTASGSTQPQATSPGSTTASADTANNLTSEVSEVNQQMLCAVCIASTRTNSRLGFLRFGFSFRPFKIDSILPRLTPVNEEERFLAQIYPALPHGSKLVSTYLVGEYQVDISYFYVQHDSRHIWRLTNRAQIEQEQDSVAGYRNQGLYR